MRVNDLIREVEKKKKKYEKRLAEVEKEKKELIRKETPVKKDRDFAKFSHKMEKKLERLEKLNFKVAAIESESKQAIKDLTAKIKIPDNREHLDKLKEEQMDLANKVSSVQDGLTDNINDLNKSLSSEIAADRQIVINLPGTQKELGTTTGKTQVEDIHTLPYSERLKSLKKLKESEHIKIPARTLCKTEKEVRHYINKYSQQEGSEGAMLKLKDFKYELDGHTNENIKYKKELSLDAQVIKVNKVKGTEKTFYYHCALKGAKGLHYCGKTFNTNIKANVGDIITVAFVDISGYTDNDKKWVNWWSPHVIMLREDKTTPDSIDTAWRMVKETTGRFEDKKEPSIGNDFKFKISYEEETEIIRENKKKPEANKPHKWKAAQWTHPNGHPRCLICGMEICKYPYKEKDSKLDSSSNQTDSSTPIRPHATTLITSKGKRLLLDPRHESELLVRPHAILVSTTNPKYFKGLKKGTDVPVYATKEVLKALGKYRLENIKEIKYGKTYLLLNAFKIQIGGIKDSRGIRGSKGMVGYDRVFKIQTIGGMMYDVFFNMQFVISAISGRLRPIVYNLSLKQSPPSMELLKPGQQKDFSAKRRFVLQHHWRGASIHGDMRFEMNDHLLGFTLADGEEDFFKEKVGSHWKLTRKAGKTTLLWDDEIFYEIANGKIIKSPSKSLEEKVLKFHESLEDMDEGWKVDWSTGQEKTRPAPKGEVGKREKIWCSSKAMQPKAWLKAEGVTKPREIEPVPGGTRFFPGIFVVVDKGNFELGAQKAYFKEFFLDGKIKGRIIFRLVAGLKEVKKKLNWLYWKPADQIPYVLGKRAVKENWLPKTGSALPEEWENKIPMEFKFWLKKTTKAKLIARAQAVNYLIDKEILKERRKIKIEGKDFRRGKFILTERSWKGPEVVRRLPVLDWHIKVDKYQFHLDKNPLWDEEMAAGIFEGLPGFFIPGKKEPITAYNPNKKIPANVRILDEGEIRIFENGGKSLRVIFKGKKLKGEWIFLRAAKEEIWTLTRSSIIKTIKFMFKDFSTKEKKKIKTGKDIKFPYNFPAVAFAEGTWHGTFYPWKVVKQMVPFLESAKIVIDHKDTGVLDTVGEVGAVSENPSRKQMEYEGILYDTQKGKDCAILIENGQITGCSVRLIDESSYDMSGKLVATKILDIPHIALVLDQEVDTAVILKDGKD